MRDSFHDTKAVLALAAAVLSANANGNAIDLKGFDSALIAINAGAIEGAGEFTVKLYESDTGTSNWKEVAAEDRLGAVPAKLEANSVYRVCYIGSKRFVRVTVVKAGGTSIALGVVAILGHPSIAPVA